MLVYDFWPLVGISIWSASNQRYRVFGKIIWFCLYLLALPSLLFRHVFSMRAEVLCPVWRMYGFCHMYGLVGSLATLV